MTILNSCQDRTLELSKYVRLYHNPMMYAHGVAKLTSFRHFHAVEYYNSWFMLLAVYRKGCPIHPTRVDSSLVFAIRQTGNRFANPVPSNLHESFPLLSIRHVGSRFARDLENIVDLDFEGGLKMLSIRVDSIESTRIVRIDWSLWPRFKNEEGSCIVISRILTSGGLCKVGWKCLRFESIRIVSPVVDSSCRKSISETRLRANRVET